MPAAMLRVPVLLAAALLLPCVRRLLPARLLPRCPPAACCCFFAACCALLPLNCCLPTAPAHASVLLAHIVCCLPCCLPAAVPCMPSLLHGCLVNCPRSAFCLIVACSTVLLTCYPLCCTLNMIYLVPLQHPTRWVVCVTRKCPCFERVLRMVACTAYWFNDCFC